MSSGGSHASAAERLGIPFRTASSCIHQVAVWSRDPASSQRFAAAVRDFAEHLHDCSRPTDYARRRARLRDWIIPDEDWERVAADLADATGLGPLRSGSQRKQRLFSVLAWAAITSGDPLLAPLVLAEPRTASQLRQDLAQVRYQARARPLGAAAALTTAAESYGARLARAVRVTAPACR